MKFFKSIWDSIGVGVISIRGEWEYPNIWCRFRDSVYIVPVISLEEITESEFDEIVSELKQQCQKSV